MGVGLLGAMHASVALPSCHGRLCLAQGLREDIDAAEASTVAAAVEHERVLGSLLAMHDQRLSAVQRQADAQLAALLTDFGACASTLFAAAVAATRPE